MIVTWSIIAGLIAMFGIGLGNAIVPRAVRALSSLELIVWRSVPIALIVLSSAFFFGIPDEVPFKGILFAFTLGVVFYIPLAFFYKALHMGKVGVVSPIANSSALFMAIAGVVFYNEALTLPIAVGVALVIFGIMLVSIKPEQWKWAKLRKGHNGISYAMITLVLWSILFSFLPISGRMIGVALNGFFVELGVGFGALAHLVVFRRTLPRIPQKKSVWAIGWICLLNGLAAIGFQWGFSFGLISITAPFLGASPIAAAVGAAILEKERLEKKEVLALLITVGGVMVLSLG